MKNVRACGSTLLEVLFVLSISGLLVAAAHFDFGKVKEHFEFRRTNSAITSLLRATREIALTRQQVIELQFSRNNVYRLNDNRLLFQLPKGIYIHSSHFGRLSGSDDTFIARANGSVSPGTIQLRNNGRKNCSIRVGLRGAIRNQCVSRR